MKFTPTGLDRVTIIDLDRIGDERGFFARAYCPEEMQAKGGIAFTPVHVNMSRNVLKGTLRGLHYQHPPHAEAKLVRCTRGRIFDVAVDIRPGSATRGKWFGIELDETEARALYIPEGFAHGYITLEPDSDLLYMTSTPYARDFEAGIRYDDPAVGIVWPIEPVTVSPRDLAMPLLG